MNQSSILIFFTLILTQNSQSGRYNKIFTCCKFQNSFSDGGCSENGKLQRFPETSFQEVEGTNSSEKEPFQLTLRKRNFKFKCNADKLVKHTFNPSISSVGNKNTIQLNENDGYVTLHDEFISPDSFCVDRLSEDLREIAVFRCNSDKTTALPKCCPWGQFSKWSHPELCKRPQNVALGSTISKSHRNYYLSPINCISVNRDQMVETVRIDIFNQSELDAAITNLTPGTYCFDDVVSSYDMTFDWQKNVALFYCDKDWPYIEFGVTDMEMVMYGGCLSLSSIFLLVAIFVYIIRLKKTHCHVHTWIELFYMISLLSLAVFCILHINFPEDHFKFCSMYHLFSVLGYLVSAIGVFTWATLLSVELFLAFRDLRPVVGPGFSLNVERLFFYACFGHLFPLLVAASTVGYSYYWKNSGYCVKTDYIFIRIMFAALLVVNFICCICTLHLILRHRKCALLASGTRSAKSKERLNQLVSCFIKLYLICGITFGGIIIGYFVGTVRSSAWYFMCYRAFLNLRGVTVFFIFICNKKTKNLMSQYIKKERFLCSCGVCSNKTANVKKSRLNSFARRTDTNSI